MFPRDGEGIPCLTESHNLVMGTLYYNDNDRALTDSNNVIERWGRSWDKSQSFYRKFGEVLFRYLS